MNWLEPNAPAYRFYNNELVEIHLEKSLNKVTLLGLNDEEALVRKNVELLLAKKPALNMLLWGEKGGGKSTLVRILARDYAGRGLRVIEFCDTNFYNIYNRIVLVY